MTTQLRSDVDGMGLDPNDPNVGGSDVVSESLTGLNDGFDVGLLVGTLNVLDGAAVGLVVGAAVGIIVGAAVGIIVGEEVGKHVGE